MSNGQQVPMPLPGGMKVPSASEVRSAQVLGAATETHNAINTLTLLYGRQIQSLIAEMRMRQAESDQLALELTNALKSKTDKIAALEAEIAKLKAAPQPEEAAPERPKRSPVT